MRPAVIIEVEIAADRRAGLGHSVVGSEIHLLVFDAAPQPLNEDVVAPRALSVHADRDAILDQHAGERDARELRALVCVEDLWLAVLRQSLTPAWYFCPSGRMRSARATTTPPPPPSIDCAAPCSEFPAPLSSSSNRPPCKGSASSAASNSNSWIRAITRFRISTKSPTTSLALALGAKTSPDSSPPTPPAIRSLS